ncbi:hypothetical protein [Pseudoalteromonas rubra]|nr:hypothetical protein [Pseudoalteromonas rubra]
MALIIMPLLPALTYANTAKQHYHIQDIIVEDGWVTLRTYETSLVTPVCARTKQNHNANVWVFFAGTPQGQAMHLNLLMAASHKLAIKIKQSDTCRAKPGFVELLGVSVVRG